MLGIFQDIVRSEGAANLYRGVWSPVMAEAPKRAIKFSLNAVGAAALSNSTNVGRKNHVQIDHPGNLQIYGLDSDLSF